MTKALLRGLLASMVLACFLGSTRAAEPKPTNPIVVLVGVSEFADKQINPRPHAEDDAKALYDLFIDKAHLGVAADRVRLLLGKEDAGRKSQPATKQNILDAVQWLQKEAKADDLVIFAYLGEGGSLGERGDRRCYFGSDSTLKERDKNAVAASEIGEAFNKLKSTRVVVLLDVNFKGFTTKESIPQATLGSPPYKEFLGDDGTEDHMPVPGRVVYVATDGLTPSLDLEKHGVFTTIVLDALKGTADTEGKEADGVVVVDELTEFVIKQVQELCRENGKTKEQKEQFPFTFSRGNHFVITRNPAVTAKVQEQLKKLDVLIKDKAITEKIGEEGRDLLSRMPKLQAQRDLRKAFQSLVNGKIDAKEFDNAYARILDSTKLDPDAAKDFSLSVMKAMRTVRTKYVKEVTAPDLISWAVRGLYKRLEEKVPEDINEKLGKLKDANEKDLEALLAEVRLKLGKREDLDNHKDIDIALQRMMSHLDPYTTYIDKETKEGVDKDIEGSFTGIGIQIRKDAAKNMLQVVTPIRGSPAHKKGIQAGDIITTIIREEDSLGKPLDTPEKTSTKDLSLSDAVKKILGKPDTKVKLVIEREGEAKPLEVEVTRGRVEVETVLGYRRTEDGGWNYYVDPENKIAYFRLTSFGRFTAANLTAALEELKKKEGIKGLVLDLRFNPGGLLISAVQISDLFISDGLIVTVRPRVGEEEPYNGKTDNSLTDFPMVCMVNGLSASGSEIVSACLQDQLRAVIVGERSYGKGSVQNIERFEGGDLKVTTATFWRPNNKNLNKSSTKGTDDEDWGVRPNKGFLVDLTLKEREDLAEYQHNSEIIDRADRYKAGQTKLNEFKDVQMDKALLYIRDMIKLGDPGTSKK